MTLAVWHGLAAAESSGDLVVLSSPSVTVTDRSDGSTPQVYADRDGNTALGNPFTADADGNIEFYVPPGRYKIEATAGGNTVTWDDELIGTLHGIDSPTDGSVPEYDDANDRYTQRAIGTGNDDLPTGSDVLKADPEHATDSATDTYDSATNTSPPADGVQIVRDFQSPNTTTTPTLDGKTLTTRDGSALWANAVSGVHALQRDETADTYLVLEPNPSIQDDPVARLDTFTQGHIDGLELSNGTDADHDIDIATGVCSMRDGSGNRKLFELTSALTKQIDANWAEGTDAGGFPSSLTLSADTDYIVFLIGEDDGTVDAGFDTSETASNLLTDASAYSWFRRVGSMVTDGAGNLRGFIQKGDEFLLNTVVNDYDATDPGTSAVLRALTCPAGQTAIHSYQTFDGGPNRLVAAIATSPDQEDTAPSPTVFTHRTSDFNGTGPNGATTSMLHIRTNSSSQIRTRVETSDAAIRQRGTTFGWIDDRGRNA